MNLAEAVMSVCTWPAFNDVEFRLQGARQLASGFSMAFLVYPQQVVRAFEMRPQEDCQDCWQVVELT